MTCTEGSSDGTETERALLLELVRGRAPRSMLTFEGFTPREIAGAIAGVSLESARPGNSGPAARETQ